MRIAILFLGILAAGCGETRDHMLEERLLAMGTWVDVTIEAGPEQGPRTIARIEEFLRRFERDYYPWADGELARVNQAIAESRSIEVSPELARVLLEARRVSELSRGSFDPGIGGLVELWGFNTERPAGRPPPDDLAIRAWLDDRAGIRDLSIEPNGVSSRVRTVKLDLGGIAKGAAVDRMLELIAAEGISNALVNAGGDLRVAGEREGRPWRIGIQSPREHGLIGVVELRPGESAFSSGDYERYFEHDGKRLHHILDPATGYPVAHTQAITVIAGSGASADAAATALFVAGPDRWRDLAATLGIEMVLRVDVSGEVEMTPLMRERLQANGDSSSDIIAP